MLPEVSPEMLAQVMNISSLPTVDFRPLVCDAATSFDVNKFVNFVLLPIVYMDGVAEKRMFFINKVSFRD